MFAEAGIRHEEDKYDEKNNEASEPFAESIAGCRFGSGPDAGAGDYANWDNHVRSLLCRSTRPSQGVGPVRC